MLEAARRGHGDRGAVVRTGRIPTTGDCGAVSASCFAEQSAPGAGPGSSERFNRDTWVSRATNVDGLDGPFVEPNRVIAVVGWAGSDGGQASGRHRHERGDWLATCVRSTLGRLATRVRSALEPRWIRVRSRRSPARSPPSPRKTALLPLKEENRSTRNNV